MSKRGGQNTTFRSKTPPRFSRGDVDRRRDAHQKASLNKHQKGIIEASIEGDVMKKLPTLFDMITSDMHRGFKGLQTELMQSKRFIFDSEASAFIGELVHHVSTPMLMQHQWARAPFPMTWVEIDHRAYYDNAQPVGTQRDPAFDESDLHFGVLIHHHHCSVICSSPNKRLGPSGVSIAMSPTKYILHQETSFEDELANAQLMHMSRMTYRLWLMGNLSNFSVLSEEQKAWFLGTEANDICRSHTVIHEPQFIQVLNAMKPAEIERFARSSTGTLKLVIVLVLMLSRPNSRLVYEEVGGSRTFLHGRTFIHRPHSRIRLRLERTEPRVVTYQSFAEGYRPSVRQEHDVRGHWCQSRKLARPGCSHEWDADEELRFHCIKCPAKRWWRNDCKRGSKKLGTETSDYDVTR